MNRLLSILLSFFDDIIPLLVPSDKKGAISIILMLTANFIPVGGVFFFGWNPFIILFIYWFESAIIGLLNIFKMLISGAVENKKFSPGGFAMGVFLSLFFTVHYGMFMFAHAIFLVFFYFMFTNNSELNTVFSTFAFQGLFGSFLPETMTFNGFIESELFSIAALFIYHIINFYLYFIATGEYDKNSAPDYMVRPYKRIVIMQVTIIFGGFGIFISGFKSIVFIIIWIGLKILSDLKITAREFLPAENSAIE